MWNLHLIDSLALLWFCLMTGVEICVGLFIQPTLRRAPSELQVRIVPGFAGTGGQWMPFWYISSLLLMLADAWMHHHIQGKWNGEILGSVSVLAAVIAGTIAVLVPINNRLSRMRNGYDGWLREAKRWDSLHRVRVFLLLIALLLLCAGQYA